MKLNSKQARQLCLQHQGLLQRNTFGSGKEAVQSAIEKLLYVQIDTISVVDRAHHHVLTSRIDGYHPDLLHELQSSDRSIFEYWSHAAAYLPTKDYRYYTAVMAGYKQRRPADKTLRKQIIKRIKTEGPLQSKDFENIKGKKSNGWWDWKPAKLAMEKMFLGGELMISERRGFQKVYDLPENVLPSNINQSKPSEIEQGHFYATGMLNALGLATKKQIAYSRPTIRRLAGFNIQTGIDQAIDELVEDQQVSRLKLEDEDYYCLSALLEEMPIKASIKTIRFLSPFDNLVINRDRLRKLFNFDYQIECYVPESKRKYGYFTLPMLYGDQIVGRIDCKADRKTSILAINNIWLEEKTKINASFVSALQRALKKFQTNQNCNETVLIKVENKALAKALQE